MKLLPRRASETGPPTGTTDRISLSKGSGSVADPAGGSPGAGTAGGPSGGKGRPTPKRRETAGTRGPAAPPPRTRKEAYRWQKEQAARAKAAGRAGAGGAGLTREAHREALRRGDPSVLPRRDQGPAKALARDYVDSHRMASNYLLLAFLLILAASILPILQVFTLVVLAVVVSEWYLTGKRLKRMCDERGVVTRDSAFGLGFYAGSRAYLPRRWRMPAPRVSRGDAI